MFTISAKQSGKWIGWRQVAKWASAQRGPHVLNRSLASLPTCSRWLLVLLIILSGCGGPPSRVRVGPVSPNRIPTIRVGILTEQQQVKITGTGRFQVLDQESGEIVGKSPRGRIWALAPSGAWIEPTTPEGQSQGLYTGPILVKSAERGGRIWVSGREYRGIIELRTNGKGMLTVVNELDIENYLRGVVPVEIGRLKPSQIDAVKAQAIAARTYALAHQGRRAALGFDIYGTVNDQVYRGHSVESSVADQAIAATHGMIATYKGKMIDTFYSSTCGGSTDNIHEGWKSSPVPYLSSVKDKGRGLGDFCHASPWYRWDARWDRAALEEILASSLPASARRQDGKIELQDIRIRKRSTSGRVHLLEIKTNQGKAEFRGDAIRSILRRPTQGNPALRSTLFNLKVQRDGKGRPKSIVIEGAGFGHGIGLCQTGAIGMADRGYRFDQILKHYYRGINLRRAY